MNDRPAALAGPPTGPLAGWRVLVPRPVAGSSPAAVALAAVGAEAVLVPLVATVPPDDVTALDDTLLALGAGWYGWLAVTSAAAVTVLEARAAAGGTTLATLVATGGVTVAAVGPGTARALREAGVEVQLVPRGESTAAALVSAWPAPDARPRVLFPRGDLAAPTFADGLRARGWRVDDVVAYRTVPAPPPPEDVRAAWSSGEIRAALLTSASTVRELHDRLGTPPARTLLVAIGPTTAAEAARLGLPLAGIAATQTMAGLVAALVDAAAVAEGRTAPAADTTGEATDGATDDRVARSAVTGSGDAASPPGAAPPQPRAGGTFVSPAATPSVPQQPGAPGPEEIA
ncbi:hypothetical protein Cch01nite_26700 [Cellulomonas chitinilytica]|uniref:Uroporphyrinogen-III synthase n=1 Tax=Cellulomonas chitinilytica TaxID=398759 RepID=A0A919P5E6_9CELL|nr:uroporphyrinogen-III synthase [Cellulomonas chitinilytica]GIG21946.1 hypothetical protein Cch01nite_26700 [Cellulomonas chitinilytica]